jgi:hypothetical protein
MLWVRFFFFNITSSHFSHLSNKNDNKGISQYFLMLTEIKLIDIQKIIASVHYWNPISLLSHMSANSPVPYIS